MTTKRNKAAQASAHIIHPGESSTFVEYLLQQFVEGKGIEDDADGVRRILDAELGGTTLTGELYKMRAE